MTRRIAAGLGLIGLGLVIAMATGWGALALVYLWTARTAAFLLTGTA